MSVDNDLLRAARSALTRGEWGAVWKYANAHLNMEPEKPEALYLAGCALRQAGHVGLGASVFRRVLALNNTQVNAWMHYGACLHDLHRWDEAREAFLVVHKHAPKDAMPIGNIASGYVQLGKCRDAVEWADRALAIDPKNHIANIAAGFGNLGLGRWKEGWKHAEYLYGSSLQIRVYRDPSEEEPIWDGAPGQTVVVQCDQGLGDQIMFASCLDDLADVCKSVILECDVRMAALFRRNFPRITVYDTLKHTPIAWPKEHPIDSHIHISWLGRYFRNRNEEFPRRAYLKPDPALVAKWRERLSVLPRPWLGLAWQGGIQQTMMHLRSFGLEELAPVMEGAGTLVDMCYQDTAREVAQWNIEHPGQQVLKFAQAENNYDDTVALASVLDDVVTVTTTLAHVCGALGRHAYVLVPQAPQWRYQYPAGEGLWWYPEHSVQLYRQKPGEKGWAPAIKRVAEAMGRVRKLRQAA